MSDFYKLDTNKIQTLDDIKNILKAMDLDFEINIAKECNIDQLLNLNYFVFYKKKEKARNGERK